MADDLGPLAAYFDGFFTGLDTIGTIIGNLTGSKCFIGHVADKYSAIPVMESLFRAIDGDKTSPEELRPSNRNVTEQICKGIGDVVGIAGNVLTLGIPQGIALLAAAERYRQEQKTRNVRSPGTEPGNRTIKYLGRKYPLDC
jgi:hypothetical protein